jgi:hypothetical protein
MYTVSVREKRKKDAKKPLGDISDGVSLQDAVMEFLQGFDEANQAGTRTVASLEQATDGDDLRAVFHYGQNGIVADIVDSQGVPRLHQEADDSQLVRCAALFRLPKNRTLGWLAVHVNNSRGVKYLLEKGLQSRFRERYPELVLEIEPYVLQSVLQEAVNNNRVDKVTLTKLESPDDRAVAQTADWVPAGVYGYISLDITVRQHAHILTQKLRQFLGGDHSVRAQIVQFGGITFDEAKVEVILPNNRHKTFNIEKPEAGHAFTQDLDDQLTFVEGAPTDESLFKALADSLSDVASKS